MDELLSLITNSATKQIYCNPIVTDAGEVHENNEYDGDECYDILPLKYFIADFLVEFPEYREQQYVPDNRLIYNGRYLLQQLNKKNYSVKATNETHSKTSNKDDNVKSTKSINISNKNMRRLP